MKSQTPLNEFTVNISKHRVVGHDVTQHKGRGEETNLEGGGKRGRRRGSNRKIMEMRINDSF